MSKTGRMVIYEGVGRPFRLAEYPVPEPGPGAALVRISLANVCGSDLHVWRGDGKAFPMALPRNQGHEGTGRIAALGEGVTADSRGVPLAVGDRVVFSNFFPCGRCRACIKGRDWLCPLRKAEMSRSCDDWPHFRGTFGEYYYLFPHHTVLKVPDDLPDPLLPGVNCAMSQVFCGWEVAGIESGDSVVIQGAGGLGLYAIAVAREHGAGQIIVIDGVPERLALAEAFGADELIDIRELPTPERRIARVKELTGGWGADAAMEVAGFVQTVEEGIQMMGQGGRYVEIGNATAGYTYAADPEVWVHGNITIYGNNNYGRRHLAGALDLLRRTRHKYPYERIASRTFPLEQVNEVMAAQDRGEVTRACFFV